MLHKQTYGMADLTRCVTFYAGRGVWRDNETRNNDRGDTVRRSCNRIASTLLKGRAMAWELKEVSDVDCTLDNSGVYVVVNRVVRIKTHKEYSGERVLVRADLMATGQNFGQNRDEPIMSFIGSANNVRKHLIRFIKVYSGIPSIAMLSWEHASYIGYELHRAESDPNYVQD